MSGPLLIDLLELSNYSLTIIHNIGTLKIIFVLQIGTKHTKKSTSLPTKT